MESLQTKVDNNSTAIQDAANSLIERLYEITAEACEILFPNNSEVSSEEYDFIRKCVLDRFNSSYPATTDLLRKEKVL